MKKHDMGPIGPIGLIGLILGCQSTTPINENLLTEHGAQNIRNASSGSEQRTATGMSSSSLTALVERVNNGTATAQDVAALEALVAGWRHTNNNGQQTATIPTSAQANAPQIAPSMLPVPSMVMPPRRTGWFTQSPFHGAIDSVLFANPGGAYQGPYGIHIQLAATPMWVEFFVRSPNGEERLCLTNGAYPSPGTVERTPGDQYVRNCAVPLSTNALNYFHAVAHRQEPITVVARFVAVNPVTGASDPCATQEASARPGEYFYFHTPPQSCQ